MTNWNVFDAHDAGSLTDEERAEVERYTAEWKDLRQEDAERRIRGLARQMMALSTLLNDDDRKPGRKPSETEEGLASTVKTYAELIHRKLMPPTPSTEPAE